MFSIVADGYGLDSIRRVGDISYATTYGPGGGGLLTCSFAMALPRGFTHPALRMNTRVTLSVGGWPIGSGTLAEPDRDGWQFTVDGLFRKGEKVLALDASGNPSTDISLIIPAANNRAPGLGWNYVASELPTGSLSTASETDANLNYISQVLDRYCELNGKRWLIDRYNYLRFVTDPTTPDYALTPDVPAMATADDGYSMRVYMRYVSAVSGTPPEPTGHGVAMAEDVAAGGRYGMAESIEDVSELGYVSSTNAANMAAAVLAADGARPAYTQAVRLAPYQLTSPGGTTVPHWMIRGGHMVQHNGWLDTYGAQTFGGKTWVVGSTSWSQSDGLTVGPLGMAARTSAQVAAAQAKKWEPVFS